MAGLSFYYGFSGAQRSKAQSWWNGQLARKLRKRPSACVACGQTEGILDGHSEDYSEPFSEATNAFGLCYRCHLVLHCRFRSEEAFSRYVHNLNTGRRYAPCHSRDFGVIVRDHLEGNALGYDVEDDAERVSLGSPRILSDFADLVYLPRPFEMLHGTPSKQLEPILRRVKNRGILTPSQMEELRGLAS